MLLLLTIITYYFTFLPQNLTLTATWCGSGKVLGNDRSMAGFTP